MQTESITLFFISTPETASLCRQCLTELSRRNIQLQTVYHIRLIDQAWCQLKSGQCSSTGQVQQINWYLSQCTDQFAGLLLQHLSLAFPIYCILGSLPTLQAIEFSFLIKNHLRPVDKFFFLADHNSEIKEITAFRKSFDSVNTFNADFFHSFLPLQLEIANRTIHIGDTYQIQLPLFQFILYRFFANNSLQRSDPVPHSDYFSYFVPGSSYFPSWAWDTLSDMYGKIIDRDWNRIQQEISKIKREFIRIAGDYANLDYYQICSFGPWGASRYGIKLDKSLITIHSDKHF